ncbi:PLP-dependent aminotransferase family protein [bacterium]|nr:PLP-dependent aminotransferase family protein [bacterium]
MEYKLAKRTENIASSEVREILKIAQNPEVISFAGGMPPAELFPHLEFSQIAADILKSGVESLQYAPTEGYLPLRRWIAERMDKKWGIRRFTSSNILITGGSQAGLDLTSKLFLNIGDCVMCEEPTYLTAINAFRIQEAEFVNMPCDDQGVITDGLEELIRARKPKMIYVIPVHQNPSGRTWSLERCKKFMEIVTRCEVPVVEDCAYFEINFNSQCHCSLSAFDPKGLVLSLGSFSKVLAPGLRVAWISCSEYLCKKLAILKQVADLQTPYLNQMIIHGYVQKYDFDKHVADICRTYKERCELMIEELKKGLPKGVSFSHPDGGMFIWIHLPEFVKVRELLNVCMAGKEINGEKKKVAFVTGAPFYAYDAQANHVRLNFSNSTFERISDGIKVFCSALKEAIADYYGDAKENASGGVMRCGA